MVTATDCWSAIVLEVSSWAPYAAPIATAAVTAAQSLLDCIGFSRGWCPLLKRQRREKGLSAGAQSCLGRKRVTPAAHHADFALRRGHGDVAGPKRFQHRLVDFAACR